MLAQRYLLLMALLSAPMANAALVEVKWRGTINYSEVTTAVAVGDTISGSYIYHSTSLPVDTPGEPFVGVWARYIPLTQPTFSINGIDAAATDGSLVVTNDSPICYMVCIAQDAVSTTATDFGGLLIGGYDIIRFSLRVSSLWPLDGIDLLNDTSLPTHLNADDWNNGTASGNIVLDEDMGVTGGTISFALDEYIHEPITEVPLPAAAWLFLSAIGGLGILKRVRKS